MMNKSDQLSDAISRFSAAITSEEWSDTGKTLPPRSCFSLHPACLKNSMTA